MLSKSTISFVQSLKQKKYRQKYNNFILEGDKIVKEAILSNIITLDKVFFLPQKAHLVPDSSRYESLSVSEKEMSRISNLKTPPGLLAIAKIPSPPSIGDLTFHNISVYLDDIKDPGNLGTIIRTCEWFGVDHLLLSPETVEVYNPKVIQSTMGSYARVNICRAQLSDIKSQHPNVKVLGTSLEGENMYQVEKSYPTILIIGNESHGMSEETLTLCDDLIKIPSHPNNKAESLNAGIATAISLSHFAQDIL